MKAEQHPFWDSLSMSDSITVWCAQLKKGFPEGAAVVNLVPIAKWIRGVAVSKVLPIVGLVKLAPSAVGDLCLCV